MHMTYEILKNFILNICFLVVVENILLRSDRIKRMIEGDPSRKGYYRTKCELAVIFGLISICSTYIGVNVNGAIVNTRVIGVVAGGIIGGPLVGIGAAVIAGMHRFLFDIGGFTSVACTISTLIEGMIGVLTYYCLKDRRWEKVSLFLCGMLAEIIQMIVILLVAKPYETAVQVVSIIALPMIFFNSVGLMIFVTCFKQELIRNDSQSAENIRGVFEIMEKCLPYIRNSFKSDEDVRNTCRTILDSSDYYGVMLSDQNHIRCMIYQTNTEGRKESDNVTSVQEAEIPLVIKNVLKTGQVRRIGESKEKDILSVILKQYDLVAAPIQSEGQRFGVVGIFTKKYLMAGTKDADFIDGLAKLFATQLELNQYLEQKNMLQKAEFQALQSQINPHFLFNALNTVSSFCRTKPERARSLLVTLSNYFRKTLEGGERYFIPFENEIEHVRTYTMLEEARFEERLTVNIHVPEQTGCMVPSLILQPIVENAIKHGAMKHEKGEVEIYAKQDRQYLTISVKDTGDGIPKEILTGLYEGTLDHSKVGMANVHRRLKNIYGEDNGLKIKTSSKGSTVKIRIPIAFPAERMMNSMQWQ